MNWSPGTLTLVLLFCVLVAACCAFKRLRWLGLVVVFIVVGWLMWDRAWLPMDQPIVVRSERVAGVEAAVVQVHGGLGIFDTSFFVKKGDNWVWFYLDHDGRFWRRVNIRENPANNAIEIFVGETLVASYQKTTGAFGNVKMGRTSVELIGWVAGDLVQNWPSRRYY